MKVLFALFTWFCTGCGTGFLVGFSTEPPLEVKTQPHVCDYTNTHGQCFILKKEVFLVNHLFFSPVDIAVILDVSRSMEDNLVKLAHGFSPLMYYIQEQDWQMAFTTADHGDHDFQLAADKQTKIFGEPQRWEHYRGNEPKFGQFMNLQDSDQVLEDQILSPKTYSHFAEIFYQTMIPDHLSTGEIDCAKPPHCQGGHEQPLRVMKSVISRQASSHSLIRPESVLVFFVITDEKERSEDPKEAVTAEEVLREFSLVFGENKKLIVYGISITNEECFERQNQITDVGYSAHLSELIEKTKGINMNICDEDYSYGLTGISHHLIKNIGNIDLKQEPVVTQKTPIQVTVVDKDDRPLQIKMKIVQNTLVFSRPLPLGAKVEASYYIQTEGAVQQAADQLKKEQVVDQKKHSFQGL